MNGSRHNKNANRHTEIPAFIREKNMFSPSLRSFKYSVLITTKASQLKNGIRTSPRCRCRANSRKNMLVLREPNFVYSNRHLDLDYQNPMSFSFTNPRFVFLICDWCFVLLSPLRFCICHISREFTLWLRPTASAGTPIFCERTCDSSQKLEIMVFNILNKDIFLTERRRFDPDDFY